MLFGLPHCDDVFMRHFDRWYSPEDRQLKVFKATRPDATTEGSYIGLSPREISALTDKGWSEVTEMVDGMIEAAQGDWPKYLPITKPIDIRWIDEADKYYDTGRVKALMKRSDPGDFSNEFLIVCCEFGAILGHVLVATLPNLHWAYGWPYWESSIFDPESGVVIPPFHWAIKKFSRDGIDDGFAAKIHACVELIESDRDAAAQTGPAT